MAGHLFQYIVLQGNQLGFCLGVGDVQVEFHLVVQRQLLHIQSGDESLLVAAHQDTLAVDVVDAGRVCAMVTAAAEGEVMVMADGAIPLDGLLPVCSRAKVVQRVVGETL